MQVISLFSGIGGFELAAEWMGWKNIASCEINPFGQKILKHYWPNSYHHDDIKTIDYEKIKSKINKDDSTIVVGGFPCQPFSAAGKRNGTEDDRYLWPYCITTVRELQPTFCVFENVRGLTNWNGGLVFDQVQADLENEGYEVLPFLLPACAVNAPHRRDRIWFVARRITSDPYSHRINRRPSHCNKQTEGESERNGMDSQITGYGAQSPFTNAVSQRCRETGECFGRSSEWISGAGSEQFIANPKNIGCECGQNCDRWNAGKLHQSESGPNEKDGGESFGYSGADTDPGNERLQGRELDGAFNEERQNRREQPSGSVSEFCKITDWQQFPTQSPLCSRNDGLSTELSGITFSKHRNESIKAYGNAIVPQAALQIFKAIEQMENLKY